MEDYQITNLVVAFTLSTPRLDMQVPDKYRADFVALGIAGLPEQLSKLGLIHSPLDNNFRSQFPAVTFARRQNAGIVVAGPLIYEAARLLPDSLGDERRILTASVSSAKAILSKL